MKRASIFTLLILTVLAFKQMWKIKKMWAEQLEGGHHGCRCKNRYWT
jgi:hypothetical protein